MNHLLIGNSDRHPLLLTLMAEDFDRGLVLFDSTGRLASAAADRIPKELTERVVYFDPVDKSHVPVLNVLENVPPDERHQVAVALVETFNTLFAEGPSTLTRARSSYLLLNCARLLLDTLGATLADIPRLLTDEPYRTKALEQCKDPVVLEFWNETFPQWKPDDVLPLLGKIGALLTSPTLRAIIGEPESTVPVDGYIVLANLNRSLIGDQAAFFLGALLMSRTKGRVILEDAPFFGSDLLAGELPQERFTLSVQFLDLLPVKLRQAALAIDSKFIFATNRADAEELAFYVGVENPSSLMAPELGPQEARTPGAVIETAMPESLDRYRAVRRRSRARHTRPRP